MFQGYGPMSGVWPPCNLVHWYQDS